MVSSAPASMDWWSISTIPGTGQNKKHTVEAVVDRLRVRENMQQRLAESFETALQLADGIAKVADMDVEEADELVFSARFACPVCGYSISELEPRKFSFNNPAGACGECDGLGVKQSSTRIWSSATRT